MREIQAPGWDRGGEDDLFGYALAVDNGQLIVGIPGAPTASAAGDGMVEIYTPSGQQMLLTQRLLPVQNETDEKFGVALAHSGDDLAVGSWDAGFGDGAPVGSVHMFRRVGGVWQSAQRLVPAQLNQGDGFGSDVAISGDWLAASAPGYDGTGDGVRGAVFVYHRVAGIWQYHAAILGDDDSRPGGFACSIAMSGDRLYIADCLGDTDVANTGNVRAYRNDAGVFTLTGMVSPPDIAEGAQFGYAIDATSAGVLVAAKASDADPDSNDRVYFFDRNGDQHQYLQTQALPGPALSLQLDADRALIAGPLCTSTTTPNRTISCVRRFDRSGAAWNETAPYLQQPEIGFDGTGWSIAADDMHIHIGNPFRDVEAGPSSGAISSFQIAAPAVAPSRLELPSSLWRFAFNTEVQGDLMVAADSRSAVPDDTNEGAAWVVDLSTPNAQLLRRIDTPEPYAYERFASDAAIAGDRIVLSATRRVPGGTTAVLRTYQRNGSDVDFIDEFNVFSIAQLQSVIIGTGVEMSADRVALTGRVPTSRGESPRIAVLRRESNSWVLEALLQPPAQDEQIAINFSRLAMQGDRIALMRGELSPLPDAQPLDWAVFVYRRSGTTWSLEQTLRPEVADPPATVLFDLAMHDDEIALSTGDTLQNQLKTRVHVFRFDGSGWQQTARIEAPAGSAEFGREMSLELGQLVIESFPVTPIGDNFVVPLRMYRAEGDAWAEVNQFLPQLAPAGQGRLFEFGSPMLRDGRLFAAGRREGPGLTTHTHGVMFEFDAHDPLFSAGFE